MKFSNYHQQDLGFLIPAKEKMLWKAAINLWIFQPAGVRKVEYGYRWKSALTPS